MTHPPRGEHRDGVVELGAVHTAVVRRVDPIKGDEQLDVPLEVYKEQPERVTCERECECE